MLSSTFPSNGWDLVLHHLGPCNIKQLRRVHRLAKEEVDERTRSARELKRIVENTTSPRMLLRSVYVPDALQRSIPPPRHAEVRRPPYPDPGMWNISVMTVVSYLSTPVDPRSVFHCVDVVDFKELTGEQLRDLEVAKLECGCERELAPSGHGVSVRCIRDECACLAAFFPGIMDIHFQTFCRGNPEFAEVKAKKRGRPTARSFENQCTMRIFMSRTSEGSEQKNGQQWNIVNLKMFQNGKIQMTGCKSVEQARGAVQFLLRKLMEKAPAMRSKRDCMTQLRCFALGNVDGEEQQHLYDSRRILDAIEKSSNAMDAFMPPYEVNPELSLMNRKVLENVLLRVDNESLFSCRRVSHFFRDVVHSPEFWRRKCERELRCQCEEDKRGWHMTYKYNGRFQRMEQVRRPEHFSHPRLLYTRYRSLRRHRPFLVVEQFEELYIAGEQVAMINSDFRTNFELNLPRLFKILYGIYANRPSYAEVDDEVDKMLAGAGGAGFDVEVTEGERGRIIYAHYSPDDYVAVNLKYLSPIPPDPVPVALESDDLTDEKETVISFFIFRTGSVIINSARNEAQLCDAYEFINKVFERYYTEIWHPPSRKSSNRGTSYRRQRRSSNARRRSYKRAKTE